MKLYYIGPNLSADASSAHVKSISLKAAEPIADLILEQFQPDGFSALLGLTACTGGSGSLRRGGGWERFGRYGVTRFQSEAEVRATLLEMGNCYGDNATTSNESFFCVRSMLSCRSVTYGFDGQAFLCLRTDDDPPVSPNPNIVLVEERTDLLTQTDYMDGAECVRER